MKDIPYSVLKEDKQGFEILMLRDQNNNTFTDIAKKARHFACTCPANLQQNEAKTNTPIH